MPDTAPSRPVDEAARRIIEELLIWRMARRMRLAMVSKLGHSSGVETSGSKPRTATYSTSDSRS
jgi:hypothetical protein